MNRLKNFSMILILAFLYGCGNFEEKEFTKKPFVNIKSAELYIGSACPAGKSTVQLKSSPAGVQYKWSSLDEAVASVSQTGLVTAKAEGFAIIRVASDNDYQDVNIRVRKWVPLEGFTFGSVKKYLSWGDRFQIFVNLEPVNASEVNIEWSSSDSNRAQVLDNGWVTYWGEEDEEVTITATIKGVGQQSVTVYGYPSNSVFIDRSVWTVPGYNDSDNETIGYSSQQKGDGGGIMAMFDGNTGSYWHSRYGPATKYPQWFIVNLHHLVEIRSVMMQRRQNDGRGQTGYFFYTCESDPTNENDPENGYDWKFMGDISWDPGNNSPQVAKLDPGDDYFPKARYIKFYFDPKHRGQNDFVMVSEVGIYGVVIE